MCYFAFYLSSPCAFTPGAYINNRSLMPCQEPPVATSTWQAIILVPKGCVVLSSGDAVKCKQECLRALNKQEGMILIIFIFL